MSDYLLYDATANATTDKTKLSALTDNVDRSTDIARKAVQDFYKAIQVINHLIENRNKPKHFLILTASAKIPTEKLVNKINSDELKDDCVYLNTSNYNYKTKFDTIQTEKLKDNEFKPTGCINYSHNEQVFSNKSTSLHALHDMVYDRGRYKTIGFEIQDYAEYRTMNQVTGWANHGSTHYVKTEFGEVDIRLTGQNRASNQRHNFFSTNESLIVSAFPSTDSFNAGAGWLYDNRGISKFTGNSTFLTGLQMGYFEVRDFSEDSRNRVKFNAYIPIFKMKVGQLTYSVSTRV